VAHPSGGVTRSSYSLLRKPVVEKAETNFIVLGRGNIDRVLLGEKKKRERRADDGEGKGKEVTMHLSEKKGPRTLRTLKKVHVKKESFNLWGRK